MMMTPQQFQKYSDMSYALVGNVVLHACSEFLITVIRRRA
jgi:hypothetical protein